VTDSPRARQGLERAVCEVRAGGAVLLSGMAAHAAGPNRSGKARRAMSFVLMPEGARKNANHGAIPRALAERVAAGELLSDDEHLPMLYSSRTARL
jgi:ectoine hydroxylase-related dioxygenase (phytanoyl-CoA dioxygenase family)